MYQIEFELPIIPKSLNITLRMHPFVRNKHNKEIYEAVHLLTCSQKPPQPLQRAILTFVRCSSRFLDYDNCVGSLKPVVDGLRHAGIIADDTYQVTGPWDVKQEKCPTKEQCIFVKVQSWDTTSQKK